jgi:hypothetical protein
MQNVQFTEENNPSQPSYSVGRQKGIIGWLIRKGFAKSIKQANIILVIIVIACIVGAVWMLTLSPSLSQEKAPAVQFDDVFKGRFKQ